MGKKKTIVAWTSTIFVFALFIFLLLMVRANGLAPSITCLRVPGQLQFKDSTYSVNSIADMNFPKGVHAGDTLSLKFSLPSKELEGKVLRLKTYHSAVIVFENGKEIYSYGKKLSANGRLVGSGVHHIDLNPQHGTEEFEIMFIASGGDDLASVHDADLVPSPFVMSDFFTRHFFAFVVGIFLTLFGMLAVLVSMATAFYGVKAYRSFLIGLFSCFQGVWTLCYMKLLQMVSFNFALNTSIEYFCLYSAPLPFCLLLMDMRKGKIKNWKWWGLVVYASIGALFLVVSTTLHALNILPYPGTLRFYHAYVVLGLLYCFMMGILYGKKMDLSLKLLSFGVVLFALIAFADLARHVLFQFFNVEHSLLELTLIPLGTLVFVLMLVGSYLVYLFRLQEVRAEKDLLATMAYADSLTGLFNRAKCQQIFDAIDKTTVDFAIVSCDMNGLKFVNDHYGHQVGDSLIKAFASVLKESFAGIGTTVRMGGDEFLAIIRLEHLGDVEMALAKLKELSEDYPEELPIPLEAACGIAYRHELSESATCEMVYHAADEKMYAMKSCMKSDLVRK